MNILDEDIGWSQRRPLEFWKIHFRQIGVEIGRSGQKDRNEVIPLLHQLRHATFFTRDHGFYHPTLRHAWSTSMSGMTKVPNISADSYAIQPFALRLIEWAKWCVCTIAD